MMSDMVSKLAVGQVLSYTTPGLKYTVRLQRLAGMKGQVEILQGERLIQRHPEEPLTLAADQAREESKYWRVVDLAMEESE